VQERSSFGALVAAASGPPNIMCNFFDRHVDEFAESVSFIRMIHEQALRARQKLLDRLPVTGEILRGSLLHRTIRPHGAKCAKCSSGEGHPLSVLTVTYPGGRTRQFSLRRELVPEVRRWLDNYQKLKEALEAICELNHQFLRPDATASKRGRKRRD
jgi:hypothetical protein